MLIPLLGEFPKSILTVYLYSAYCTVVEVNTANTVKLATLLNCAYYYRLETEFKYSSRVFVFVKYH